jgi:hypothetical protein
MPQEIPGEDVDLREVLEREDDCVFVMVDGVCGNETQINEHDESLGSTVIENSTNTNPATGFVSCSFNSATATARFPPCNVSANTASIAAEFSDSNDLCLVRLVAQASYNSHLKVLFIHNHCFPPCLRFNLSQRVNSMQS